MIHKQKSVVARTEKTKHSL